MTEAWWHFGLSGSLLHTIHTALLPILNEGYDTHPYTCITSI